MDAGVITAVATFSGIGVLLIIATAYLVRTRKAMLTGIEQAAVWGSIAGYFVWFLLLPSLATGLQSTAGAPTLGALIFVFVLSGICILPTAYLHYQQSKSGNSAAMIVIGGAIAGGIAFPILIARNFYDLVKLKPPPKLSAPEGVKEEQEASKEDLEKEA